MPFRILMVAGARPNFVKLAPVLAAIEGGDYLCDLVHTGQHYEALMSDVFFSDLGIRRPDYFLGVGSGSHALQTATVMTRLEELVGADPPDAVVVFGDVNSTLGAALVGVKMGLRVVHVEAGLRSRDWSMPEEVNRVVVDRISDLLLAPSQDGADNLLSEGVSPQRIRVVGNVMVDSLFSSVLCARARERPAALDGLDKFGLVTLHRPANVDDPVVLQRVVAAISDVSRSLPLLWPIHPRVRQRLASQSMPSSVILCEPLGYLDFIAVQADARLVLTDSGGVQEETTALGVPCLTLRENTERPITITQGTNRLVGTDPSRIVAEALEVLANPPSARRPALWDGRAGERCAAAIEELLETPDWPRPTDLP